MTVVNTGRKSSRERRLTMTSPLKELGEIAPYGVYSINHNTGFVNMETSHDTGEFVVESI
jgi:hypothetical protein